MLTDNLRERKTAGLTTIECKKQNCYGYVFAPSLLAGPSGLSSDAQGQV